MLGNMLNDLAEAIRRWTEKKSCGLAVFLGFCAPRCACVGPDVSRVVCPPLLWFLSLSFLPSLPRDWSYLCSGPACTSVCWCLPLGIWLQL